MYARVVSCGQAFWYHDVTRIVSNGQYLTLDLQAHPSRVHYWLSDQRTSILLAATGPDVTALLREEMAGDDRG